MAKKPTVTTVASGYYGRQALNDNFEALRDAFDNTLSRDGSTPNAMGADFDMNGYRVLNAGQIDTDALYLNGVAVRSATDVEFQTTYLTASYTGNGSTVAYSLTANPQSEGNVSVYVDGVYQNKDTFSLSGTTITFSEAPPLNSSIEIVYPSNTDTLNGSISSAITYNQGGTNAQDRTVEQKLQEFVSVKDFGAVGDGIADDTVAIQAALDYASSLNGARILFPRGVYHCTGQLSLNTPICVSLLGEGADNTGAGGSIIEYSGTSSPFIELLGVNSRMFTWEGIDVRYTSTSFSGTLVRMPCFDAAIKKCQFGGYGTGVENAAHLLDIDQSVDVVMEQVRFGPCQNALRGHTASGYSNAVVLNQCEFYANRLSSIVNTGQAWVLNGCSFEPNTVSGSDKLANAIVIESGISPKGLNVIGCWFGDLVDSAGSPANQWISWRGDGLFLSGNYFNGAGFKTVDAVRVVGTARGITAVGNHFSAFGAAIDLGSGLASEVVLLGNNFNANCLAFVTGSLASGTLLAPEFVLANPSGRLDLTGGLRLSAAIESTEDTNPILYASNAPASVIQADYPDGSVSDVRPIITHQHDTQATWKARISALRGAFANEIFWRFSALAGTETDVFEITNLGIRPAADNTFSVGRASYRWTTVYATTGTINTSDENEKQDIRDLTAEEKATAVTIKGLFKAFRFKDAFKEKGDDARIHVGVIAQEVKAAFEANGLDASRYGIFCSDTWTDEETGEEKTRLGVRYEELLAFVLAAI